MLVVFASIVIKELLKWQEKSQQQSPNQLEGCLHTLHSIMESSWEKENDPYLRVTLHIPIENGEKLQQLIDYIGDDRAGKTGGRTFRASCGITREAINTKGLAVASRKSEDYSLYLQELVNNQHYTLEEAKKLNPATMSWAAIALFDDKKLQAVVYCDSTVREFFTEDRQKVLLYASKGIARFIQKKYREL